MSRETGEPVIHYIAGPGWSPRGVGAESACGELVAYIRAARNLPAVTCGRCRRSRAFAEALRMGIARAGRSWGMRR